MKTTRQILITTVALAVCAVALCAEKIVAGPKGGRLLESAPHNAEFFVTDDRKVEVTFYDAALKPVDPSTETVAVIAEPSSGRTKIEMEKTASGYISKTPLPKGDPYRVVVQVRENENAKPQNFRIDLELHMCAGCAKKEYACTCIDG
jgi:hypothetical protein